MQDKDKSKKNSAKSSSDGGKATNDVIAKIIEHIEKVENILVALSKNPSVDELSAALGLTLFLDGMNKHATAIFSGKIPNALKFLAPENTFEVNTNSLQDFIIALNKEKADHLRYKLDGDYVKVFITPYKTTLSEDDLEFSHGDFNVNLIIALNVPTVDDLDAALYEHGRIMHDATAINITTGVPGKFGEVEWSDPSASSISEMVMQLTTAMRDQAGPISKEVATAFLTGIIAATERFSNKATTPTTMTLASRLMEAGADQTIIAKNVMKVGTTPAGVIDATEAVATGGSADLGSMELKHENKMQLPVNMPRPSQFGAPPAMAMNGDNRKMNRVNNGGNKNIKSTPGGASPIPANMPVSPVSAPRANLAPSQNAMMPNTNASKADDKVKQDIATAVNAGKNPAAMMAPDIPKFKDVSDAEAVTPINPAPATSSSVINGAELPPPPAPPIDFDNVAGAVDFPPSDAANTNVAPSLPPVQMASNQPANPDDNSGQSTTLTLHPPTSDPGAFRIPGA